jgi:hypothetical protein
MSKRVIPLVLLALTTLAGCQYGALQNDAQSCERLADWSDRKVCLDKLKTEEREWEKRKN